jgi:hypothetical protein
VDGERTQIARVFDTVFDKLFLGSTVCGAISGAISIEKNTIIPWHPDMLLPHNDFRAIRRPK